jgi:hypothetical protein
MLWHSGMRGAGAYAFALVWPSENRELIVDITAGVVLLTVLVLGATTVPMMRWTGTTGAQEKERVRARAAAEAVLTAAQLQQQPGGGGGGGGGGEGGEEGVDLPDKTEEQCVRTGTCRPGKVVREHGHFLHRCKGCLVAGEYV